MRKLFIVTLIFGVTTLATAQYQSGGGISDKLYFGGGFGLSTGTDVTSISASPLVGYKISDPFSVGMSLTYQYVGEKDSDASLSNFGLGPFARFQVTDEYFIHAEYEYLNYEYVSGFATQDGDVPTERNSYNSLWLGVGYGGPIGRNGGFFVLALYNVLYDPAEEPQPYASPLSIRAGFAVGF